MLAQILTAVRPPASPSSETELEPVPEVEAEPEEMEESKKGEREVFEGRSKETRQEEKVVLWCAICGREIYAVASPATIHHHVNVVCACIASSS